MPVLAHTAFNSSTGIQLLQIFSPLKIIIGAIELPSTQIRDGPSSWAGPKPPRPAWPTWPESGRAENFWPKARPELNRANL